MEWSEELSGGLLQAAPDAILVADVAGMIMLVNDRAEELFGWSGAELIGTRASLLLTEASREEIPRMLQRTAQEEAAGAMGNVAVAACHRNGTEIPVEASLASVDTPHGRVVVAVIRDCTERRRAAAEQARLRLEAQTHRNHRLESLGQLAGGIAHDFNNMLGVIVNYANFVIEEGSAPNPDVSTIVADAQQVVRASRRGTELTHQLLAFARREVVRPRVLDFNAVITGFEEMLRTSIGDRVTLIVRLAADLPPVTCDPGQIEQLLLNLAVNAREAMPDGGRLVIETTLRDEQVCLSVSDSGCGMPPEVVERAFEPFFTTKASGEGTGLGLATVYGIVTQASGTVTMQSEPGVGTTVSVLLPIGGSAPVEGHVAAPAATAVASAGGQGETLLVVEDEAALRDVAGRILSGAGYQVLTADGGRQALELAALHEGAIDLLLSDVVMPGMLGNELAEQMADVRPDTRVLYMSGYAQPILASQGTLDPGVVLLEKPFTAADLLSAVRNRLDG